MKFAREESRCRQWNVALVAILAAASGCYDPHDNLMSSLRDPDPQQRRAAMQRLLEMGPTAKMRQPLHQALHDEDREVRRMACQALSAAGAGGAASLPFLVVALSDDERSVRVAAALAIARIDPQHDAPAGVLGQAIRSGDGGVIVQVGNLEDGARWAIPILISRLESDPRPGIRRIAADALQRVAADSPEAAAALRRAAQSDQDDRVRESAAAESS